MEFKPVLQDTVTDGEKTGHIRDILSSEATAAKGYIIAWDNATPGDGQLLRRAQLTNPTPDVDGLNPFRIKWTVTP